MTPSVHERILASVDALSGELVDFAAELVRVPTVNPPGEHYEDCARVLGRRLQAHGFDVEFLTAAERPEHSAAYPRVNVLGSRDGVRPGPTLHLNGHLDVVPAGVGWSVDPFAGVLRDGPADNAGLMPGDVVTSINGTPTMDARDAMRVISEQRPDTVIELGGIRKETAFTLKARVIQRPQQSVTRN